MKQAGQKECIFKRYIKDIIASIDYYLYQKGVRKISHPIRVMSISDTINELKNTNKSLVRFGDGEVFLWLSSEFFPWDYILRIPILGNLLYRVQFAWRYEIVATVGLSIVTAEVIYYYGRKLNNNIYLAMLAICIINIAPYIDCVTNHCNMFFQDKYKYSYHYVDDTENIDYMYRDLPYEELKKLPRTVVAQGADVYNLKMNGVNISFNYKKNTSAVLTLPIIDYPGYKLFINGDEVEYSSNEKHQITIILDSSKKDNGKVEFKFVEPLIWRICEIISALSIIGFVLFRVRNKKMEDIKCY